MWISNGCSILLSKQAKQEVERRRDKPPLESLASLDFLLFVEGEGWTYSSCTVKILMRRRNLLALPSGISYISCLSFFIPPLIPPPFLTTFTRRGRNRQYLISKEIVRFNPSVREMPRCLGQMDNLNNLLPKMIQNNEYIVNFFSYKKRYRDYFSNVILTKLWAIEM